MQPAQHYRMYHCSAVHSKYTTTIPGSQLPGLPITSQTVPSGSGRPAMVGTTPHLLEWEKPYFSSFNNSNRLRHFTAEPPARGNRPEVLGPP